MRACRDRKPMAEWGSQMGTKLVAQSLPGRPVCSGGTDRSGLEKV